MEDNTNRHLSHPSDRYMTLRDVVRHQNPGVRQNSYKYKILNIRELFDSRFDQGDLTLKKFKQTQAKIYLNIEDIPENLMDYKIYNIEPEVDDNRCLYLRIDLL